ncbi:hypothetical protein L9F63_026499, partial [Diploptera punctata]
MFLLTDNIAATFDELMKPLERGSVFSDWLKSQTDGFWEDKLLESLCIIQNFQ